MNFIHKRAVVGHERTQAAKVVDFSGPSPFTIIFACGVLVYVIWLITTIFLLLITREKTSQAAKLSTSAGKPLSLRETKTASSANSRSCTRTFRGYVVPQHIVVVRNLRRLNNLPFVLGTKIPHHWCHVCAILECMIRNSGEESSEQVLI